MDFVKMEGLGNDFVVVDGPVDMDPAVVRRWCDRRFGIGADGVLEITRLTGTSIRMRYWNADGGEAEMCGNGLRCLAKLAVARGWVEPHDITIATAMGDLPAQVLADGTVRALVGSPVVSGPPAERAGVATVHPISVGNPHAVVFVADPDATDVENLGPLIESDELFPDQTNVEFVTIEGPDRIRMRIWERGVGETMASGTGATAAAFAAVTYRDVTAPVTVSLRGGRLVVEFENGAAWMIGPANVVFNGRVDIEGPA